MGATSWVTFRADEAEERTRAYRRWGGGGVLCRDLGTRDGVRVFAVDLDTWRLYLASQERERQREAPPPRMCRKGLHDLNDPANRYVQPSTGHVSCQPCKLARQRRNYEQGRAS